MDADWSASGRRRHDFLTEKITGRSCKAPNRRGHGFLGKVYCPVASPGKARLLPSWKLYYRSTPIEIDWTRRCPYRLTHQSHQTDRTEKMSSAEFREVPPLSSESYRCASVSIGVSESGVGDASREGAIATTTVLIHRRRRLSGSICRPKDRRPAGWEPIEDGWAV